MTRFVIALALACSCSIAALAAEQSAKAKPSPAAIAANQASSGAAIGTLGISGNASALVGCAGGTFYNTHVLGAAVRGMRVRVDVASGEGIDPMVSLVILQMGPAAPGGTVRAGYVFDDDSGGGRDPRLEFTAEYDGNMVLSVGSYDGAFGCYGIKVEVIVP